MPVTAWLKCTSTLRKAGTADQAKGKEETTAPLGPVEIFGKAGEYYYNVDTTINFDSPGPGIDSSHSRNDFVWGGGVGYVIASHVTLRAEYEKLEIKNGGNTDALWLGAHYRF